MPPYWRCPARANGPHDADDPRGRLVWDLLSALVRRAAGYGGKMTCRWGR